MNCMKQIAFFTILLLTITACQFPSEVLENEPEYIIEKECEEWIREQISSQITIFTGPIPTKHIIALGNGLKIKLGGRDAANYGKQVTENYPPVIEKVSYKHIKGSWLRYGASPGENRNEVYGGETWRVQFYREGKHTASDGQIEAVDNRIILVLDFQPENVINTQKEGNNYRFNLNDTLTIKHCKITHWE